MGQPGRQSGGAAVYTPTVTPCAWALAVPKPFAVSSVWPSGPDYNVTDDTERQGTSRSGRWGWIRRNQRRQSPFPGPGAGHRGRPQEPPYFSALAVPGGPGCPFAGGD